MHTYRELVQPKTPPKKSVHTENEYNNPCSKSEKKNKRGMRGKLDGRAHARLMSVRVRVRARTGSLWRREPECVGVWEKAKRRPKEILY
jgi:hypothetical protein